MRLLAAVLAILVAAPLTGPAFAQEQRNMVVNFGFEQGFDDFASGEIGKGWTPYIISGALSFKNTAGLSPDFIEKIEGGTSQTLWSDGNAFVAGMYQVRGVTPGKLYKAWFATAAKIRAGSMTRTIGLDPTGGTNPQAKSVQWGTSYGGEKWATIEKGDAPNVRAHATSDKMTLFVKVDNTGGGQNQAYIDSVWMVDDGGIAIAPQSPPQQATAVPTATAVPSASPAAPPVAPPAASPIVPPASGAIPPTGGTLPPAGQLPGSNGKDDFAAAGGWFYSQANGQDAGGKVGFTITNDDNIPFYDYFRRYGGPLVVGYPISHRFMWDGFVSQAFQKVVFQYRPDQGGVVALVNVFDQIAAAGKDDYFVTVRQIPKSQDWSSDDGKSFQDVVANHQKILDPYPALKDAYFASPDPVNLQGLPMSVQDYPAVTVVRCQRVVFQQWKTDQPWAKAGQVVVANGGDIAKEAQLLPAGAIEPKEPGFKPNPLPVVNITPGAPAAPPAAPPAATPGAPVAPPSLTPGVPIAPPSLTPGVPIAPPAAPTAAPTAAPVSNAQYGVDGISYLPNCGLTRLIVNVKDASGNPVNNVYVIVETGGGTKLPSNPTGQPGAYDPGQTDVFLRSGTIKNTWTATLSSTRDTLTPLSDPVQFETTDNCQGPDAKQIVTITFKKKS